MKTPKNHSEINWPLARSKSPTPYRWIPHNYAVRFQDRNPDTVFRWKPQLHGFCWIQIWILRRLCFLAQPHPREPSNKVIYPMYSKYLLYTVAHTIDSVCSKMLNHGLNHGLFFSLFKLLPCHIHWIVYVNFVFKS